MRAYVLLLAALGCSGCGGDDSPASQQDIKDEFAAYVAARNQCATDDECVLATSECPLGCSAAVRRDFQAEVEGKARELIERYERGCSCSCIYGCVPAFAACRESRCQMISDQ